MASKKSAASSGPEMLRRISARDLCGNIRDLVKDAGGAVELFQIYGIATGIKSKTTNFGEATAVTGMFEVVRCSDGVVFMGTVAYLPEPAGSTLVERVKSLENPGDNVQFAMTIGAKPDAKSSTGYVYTMKPFLKPEERNQLDALRSEVRGLIEQE